MTQNKELLETIEKLRSEEFPDVPADLVAGILFIESESLNDRAKAGKSIQALIALHLEKEAINADAEKP